MGDRPSERLIFNILSQKYGLSEEFVHNTGTTSGDDEGKPDFTVSHQGGTLGVEITEIYVPEKTHGKTLREHEAAKQKVMNDARERAVKAGLPSLCVRVNFQGDLAKGRVAPLTEALFHIVKCHCPEADSEEIELDGESGLPNEFWRVYIHNYGDGEQDWDYIEAGGVATEFSSHIQEKIDTKSKKLPKYLQHCRTCWLIIAALGNRPSSFYHLTDRVETVQYISAFEKVFFVNVPWKTVAELHVTKGGNKGQ